ncbi:hypothetical protein [Vallitalea okinawensis]|nr:hypothetical protein [Vallitalea okinawensis]
MKRFLLCSLFSMLLFVTSCATATEEQSTQPEGEIIPSNYRHLYENNE